MSPIPHDYEALLRRLAIGLDVPPQILGMDLHLPVPPRSRRERLAGHVGQAGWRAGWWLARTGHRVTAAGHRLQRVGDKLIDAGDWLAGKVAGR